jgi:hypothetical protein
MAAARVTSSENLGCTVHAGGGMSCEGIMGVPSTKEEEKKAKLFVTYFILEPGATLDPPSSSSDCLIIGINGGDLMNEKPPLLHVLLEKGLVTLLPRKEPFRLRNQGSHNVELRLVEIQR